MSRNFKQCRWILLLLGCVIAIHRAVAAPVDNPSRDVIIVMGDTAPASRQMAETLNKKIRNAKILSDADAAAQKRKNVLYIAIGEAAFQSLLTQTADSAILAVLTSSQAYRLIIDGTQKPRNREVSAVYAEASPSNQLKLAAYLIKGHGGLVTFLSEKTAYLKPTLQRAAAQAAVDLEILQLSRSTLLTQELDQMASVRGVLALPDTSLYTPENIRAMLITSYRQNQFVIGFSSSFVKAGALASTYSTIDDIANQAVEISKEFNATSRLPAAQYPKYFSVTVNDNVARSLNIIVNDEVRNFSNKPLEVSQ